MRLGNFLMVYYDTPEFIKDIQNKIPKDELYFGTEEDVKNELYGIEKDTHVTVLACIDEKYKPKEFKKYLKPLKEYFCFPINISVFENEKYDVLKCDVISNELSKTNAVLEKEFENRSKYDDYKPHLTIAYLKKGKSDKYKKELLDKIDKLEPISFVYGITDSGEHEKWK